MGLVGPAVVSVLIRTILLLLALSVLGGCAGLPTRTPQEPTASPSGRTPRFEIFEAVLTGQGAYANPFQDVSVTMTFVAPDGRELKAPAFYDGDSTWRARIAPDMFGTWHYRSTASNPSDSGLHGIVGEFDCVTSAAKGFIGPDPRAPYWFAFSDGSPFYGIGDTAYGLVSGVSDRQLVQYLDERARQGFNFIRIFASGFPLPERRNLSVDDSWPWGGTPEQPDYDRFNPRFFQRLERLVKELARRDMYAEVLIFNYYDRPFVDPSQWTAEREESWARHVISRLAAFRSVFLWTVANEYENYPNGKYRYDGAADDAWAKRMGAMFRRLDPEGHPTTAHNFSFDSDGGIGERFGKGDEISVLSQQEWGEATWRGRYLDGSAVGIERAIQVDRRFDKPVINTENGYEWLSGHADFGQQASGTDKSRRAAWRVFMGGGASYAAGFGGTWRGTDNYHWRGTDKQLRFRLQDMGLGSQIRHLRAFIDRTDFRAMLPVQDTVNAPNLCLAAPGSEYVAYAPGGGSISIDLSTQAGRIFRASSYDPRTGRVRRLPPARGGSVSTFRGPRSHDWVLHLESR